MPVRKIAKDSKPNDKVGKARKESRKSSPVKIIVDDMVVPAEVLISPTVYPIRGSLATVNRVYIIGRNLADGSEYKCYFERSKKRNWINKILNALDNHGNANKKKVKIVLQGVADGEGFTEAVNVKNWNE